MSRTLTAFVLVFVLLFGAIPAHAFDDQRKGFFLGMNAGAGYTAFQQNSDTAGRSFGWTQRAGVITEFRLGAGITEQFLVYYGGASIWLSHEQALIANNEQSLGVLYFLQNTFPTFYLVASIGLSEWGAVVTHWDSRVGPALSAGIGYEFAKHWSLETTASWRKSENTLDVFGSATSIDITSESFSILITINGTAY